MQLLFCAYFKPHDGYFKLTFNLQHCLFAILFAFIPVLFACMRVMEIKKSTQYCMDNYWIRYYDLCRLTTTPV